METLKFFRNLHPALPEKETRGMRPNPIPRIAQPMSHLCDSTNTVEIPRRLKEYIDENRGSLPPLTDPDEPLQIDSLGLIRVIAFLESDFGFQIQDEELIVDNFATLRSLGELLATKAPTAPKREVKRQMREGLPAFSARRDIRTSG